MSTLWRTNRWQFKLFPWPSKIQTYFKRGREKITKELFYPDCQFIYSNNFALADWIYFHVENDFT
jgi:hypothetical protein